MMKKLIIGVIVLTLVCGAVFYYMKGTPKYSLYLVKKAIKNHDSLTFNKYVDIDRVTNGLIETATKKYDDEMKKDNNPFGGIGKGMFQAMLPGLKEQMKSGLDKSIEEISEDKDNKYGTLELVKVKQILQEGKSAKVTLLNAQNEEIRLDMVQTPERYWQIVGINLDDFKKISPNSLTADDAPAKADNPVEEVVIDKAIGDEVELATMKFKVDTAEERQVIKRSYGETTASENTKFVVLNMTATNITSEGYTFDEDDFKLIDGQGRKFDAFSSIGNIDNYLEMRSLQPSIPETGFIVFRIPADAMNYGIQIGKKDTNEMYRVKLK